MTASIGSSSSFRYASYLISEEPVDDLPERRTRPLESFIVIHDYFSREKKERGTESISLSMGGYQFEIVGISDEEVIEELEKAFDGVICPVIKNESLRKTLDQEITKEWLAEFETIYSLPEYSPSLRSDRQPGAVRRVRQLAERVWPGDVREALERNSSVPFKTALIHKIGPFVSPKELQSCFKKIQANALKKPLQDLVYPVVQHQELEKALKRLPARLKLHFQKTLHLLGKTVGLFDILPPYYTPTDALKVLLGEEVYSRVLKNLTVVYKIPQEKVPDLHRLIEFHIAELYSDLKEPDLAIELIDQIKNSQMKEEQRLRKIFSLFEIVQDHYLTDDLIPYLIPVTKMPLAPWPRLEVVKKGIRNYLFFERCSRLFNDQMHQFYSNLKKSLKEGERIQLLEELKRTIRTSERLALLKRIDPKFETQSLSDEEKIVLYDVLLMFLPEENELLLRPLENMFDELWDASILDLEEFATHAFKNLGSTCFDQKLQIRFRSRGRDYELGYPVGISRDSPYS